MKLIAILTISGAILINDDCFGQLIPINDNFINAIGKVETGNKDNLIGDAGHAISRYQIHYFCYLDAKEYNKSINFSYQSLTNAANAKIVLISYLNRYSKQDIINNNYENLAKCWNGGCGWKTKTGQAKINLNKYWNKVKNNI